MSNVGKVALSLIRESKVALRDVDRQSEKYMELVDSIRNVGVLNSITVRECVDPTTGETYYGLVDGLQRTTAARDAGLEMIPANIIDMDEASVVEAQIIANVHKIETKPIEYTQALMRIITSNPMMTLKELAGKLAQSEQWLSQRLSLIKLDEAVKPVVNEGKIPLSNAYALAKLPVEEQINFLDRAMTEPQSQFLPAVHARVKEIRDARLKGREAAPAVFTPVAHMHKIGDVKNELADPKIANLVIQATGATDALSGFMAGIQWVLHLDPLSVAEQKAKYDAMQAKKEEEKKKRQEEREAKKREEAAKKAAEVTLEQLAKV